MKSSGIMKLSLVASIFPNTRHVQIFPNRLATEIDVTEIGFIDKVFQNDFSPRYIGGFFYWNTHRNYLCSAINSRSMFSWAIKPTFNLVQQKCGLFSNSDLIGKFNNVFVNDRNYLIML